MDCMEGMKQFPDKYFDLAIVDPPYGIDINNQNMWTGKHKDCKKWDKIIPDKEYFDELFRVSVDQIIWGGNYFIDYIYHTRCFLIWDKMNGTNDLADAELAWTSFDKTIRIFRMHHFSKGYDNKIHPTQKPVQLYKWILHNYAKPDMKIIDTHVGSGSSIIAFLDFGCDWIGFEIDEDYHKAASERIEIHKKRPKPFFTDGELADKDSKQKGFF